MTDRANEALVRKVLSDPSLFPPEFKAWVPKHVEATPTIKFQPYQVPDVGLWFPYTPIWTSAGTPPSIGNGTLGGRYSKLGKTINLIISLLAGSTTTFGDANLWTFSLPFAASPLVQIGWGSVRYVDVAPGNNYMGFPMLLTTGTVGMTTLATPIAFVSQNVPHAWASGDVLQLGCSYEAA